MVVPPGITRFAEDRMVPGETRPQGEAPADRGLGLSGLWTAGRRRRCARPDQMIRPVPGAGGMIAFARAIAGSQSIFVEYSPPFPTRFAQYPSLSCLVFLGLWWRRRRAREARLNRLMSAQGLGSGLGEQVVLGVVGGGAGLSWGRRGPVGWFLGVVGAGSGDGGRDRPESVGSEVGAERSAEGRRLGAWLGEARIGGRARGEAASFFRAGVPVGARARTCVRRGGQASGRSPSVCRCLCPGRAPAAG